jgi:hypothetical protein
MRRSSMENPLDDLNTRVRLPVQVLVTTVSVLLPNAVIWLTIAAGLR